MSRSENKKRVAKLESICASLRVEKWHESGLEQYFDFCRDEAYFICWHLLHGDAFDSSSTGWQTIPQELYALTR